MTRRRPGVSGSYHHPGRRRGFPLLMTLAVVAVVALAGCRGSDADDGLPTARPAPTAADVTGTTPPAGSDAPTAAPGEPTAAPGEPTAAPTEGPSDDASPSSEPPSAEPTATDASAPGDVAACAGTDANREFYESVAAAVDWPVYCPTFGDGWFVDSGTYRLAGGGRMIIAYRGPSGARVELSEGNWCSDDCVPDGEELGDAAFGDMAGQLIAVDDGFAVAADDGSSAYLVVGRGLDESELRAIAGGLVRLDG